MTVDRQTTTPFLLNLFYRTGGFHRTDEFVNSPPQPLPQHLEIYTWTSCTLHELSMLIHQALPKALPEPAIGTRLAFRSIFPVLKPGPGSSSLLSGNDSSGGQFIYRDLGSVVIGEGGLGAQGPDTLGENDESDGYSSDDSRRRDRKGKDSRHRSHSRDSRSSRSRSPSSSGSGRGKSRSLSPHRHSHRSSHKGKSDRRRSPSVSKEPPSPTLEEAGFKRNDYISCAIFPPLPNGHVPGPPAPIAVSSSRTGFGDVGGGGAGPRGEGRGGGRGGSLLRDDWRRGEAPPPPSDGYGRSGIGYGAGGGGGGPGGRRRPPPRGGRR